MSHSTYAATKCTSSRPPTNTMQHKHVFSYIVYAQVLLYIMYYQRTTRPVCPWGCTLWHQQRHTNNITSPPPTSFVRYRILHRQQSTDLMNSLLSRFSGRVYFRIWYTTESCHGDGCMLHELMMWNSAAILLRANFGEQIYENVFDKLNATKVFWTVA